MATDGVHTHTHTRTLKLSSSEKKAVVYEKKWRLHQPDDRGTAIGQLINSYLEKKSNLEDHTVHLLFAANRWERVPLIKEKLQQGITLIVDRYAFSGVAFTSAKPVSTNIWSKGVEKGEGKWLHNLIECLEWLIQIKEFTLTWCKQPDVGIPKPDLILFLQLSPSDAMKRGDFGNERYENRHFQEQVLRQFNELMQDENLNWKVMDASQCIDDLHQEIKSHTEKVMEQVGDNPIRDLWR
eukprot:gi/632934482/ref/XP_007884875.1/ PREDICTED: thymidylate kinase isoform X1 [Callorhinchus milii]